MKKKYRLLEDDTITVDGRTLYQIEALRDFTDVRIGDKGGYVKSEDNLSHDGNCWVYDDAWVYGKAWVYGNAKVSGDALVCGKAEVSDDAVVCGNAEVSDDAVVCGNAEVYGKAEVSDDAVVCGNAEVYGKAEVYGYAWVFGNAEVSDDAVVCGNAEVYGKAEVSGNAVVRSMRDYVVFKNIWSSGRYFTYTRSNRMWKVGCFYGTGEELIKKAYKDSEVSGREYKRVVEYVEAMYADLENDKSK